MENTLIICGFCFLTILVLLFGVRKKWFSGFSFSKSGLSIEAKQVEREFYTGNILQIMNEQIIRCDNELIDYAIEKANYLRKILAYDLNESNICVGTRKAVISILRFPLYDASRRNDFKTQLKPEHLLWYVERIMKEIRVEYEEFYILQEKSNCSVSENHNCPLLPDMKDILPVIQREVIENWALPIRRKVVDICTKKINIYRQFAPTFREVGDAVKVKITEYCIDKNKNYISTLSRKPDIDKKEL